VATFRSSQGTPWRWNAPRRNDSPGVAISIDTTLAPVAAAALQAGAVIVNDVSAGRDDDTMFELVAAHRAGLVLMHRLVEPARDLYSDRQPTPAPYGDVVAELSAFLGERVEAAVRAGVAREAIAIDPGLGFGKTIDQNYTLLARLHELVAVHPIVMVGASR